MTEQPHLLGDMRRRTEIGSSSHLSSHGTGTFNSSIRPSRFHTTGVLKDLTLEMTLLSKIVFWRSYMSHQFVLAIRKPYILFLPSCCLQRSRVRDIEWHCIEIISVAYIKCLRTSETPILGSIYLCSPPAVQQSGVVDWITESVLRRFDWLLSLVVHHMRSWHRVLDLWSTINRKLHTAEASSRNNHYTLVKQGATYQFGCSGSLL